MFIPLRGVLTTMANSDRILNSWSLLSYARMKGKMKVGTFINKETGEAFKAPYFVGADGSVTMISFSQNLGELTPAEIKARQNELQVVEACDENGTPYKTPKLCKAGTLNGEDVDLDL